MLKGEFDPRAEEEAFVDTLRGLQGVYATHVIDEAIKNADFLTEMHTTWVNALDGAASALGIQYDDPNQLPYLLEAETAKRTADKIAHAEPTTNIVLGIAGPGATGKGTIIKELDAPRVINTTTRPPRDYETNGVDYHFVSEGTFASMDDAGAFVSTTHRPGRGNYGIQVSSLATALEGSDLTVIEENPDTLARVMKGVSENMDDTSSVAVYVLPPAPVIGHLASRLAGRCLVAGENYRNVLDSTLGKRQVEEFSSFVPLAANGKPALFVVNDNVDRAVSVIRGAASGRRPKAVL